MGKHDLWQVVRVLPTDYSDYGGMVERWADETLDYPDCSSGCKYWRPLHDLERDSADGDWGVCLNKNSLRAGLLTWEHQTGRDCFEK